MDPFVKKIASYPESEKREHGSPYYLLHDDGEEVYGTVLMFHGFSATTRQMGLLAQYLYDNGFNVYQPALCGHYFRNADKYWPKVLLQIFLILIPACMLALNLHLIGNPICAQHDLKPDIKEQLAKKLSSDPELAAYIRNFISISTLTPDQVASRCDQWFAGFIPCLYKSIQLCRSLTIIPNLCRRVGQWSA